jgi:hypothetical protein
MICNRKEEERKEEGGRSIWIGKGEVRKEGRKGGRRRGWEGRRLDGWEGGKKESFCIFLIHHMCPIESFLIQK